MAHHLSHRKAVEMGEHSHEHHKKQHDHHMKEAAKHAKHLHKMAKDGAKHHHKKEHITAHDKAVDRKNIAKARRAK